MEPKPTLVPSPSVDLDSGVKHQIFSSDSSLALHDGLVRLSGERQCEGEVEVFIHQVWRRVLLDSWSLTESLVVCRQLGCGSVLNFYGSSSSSPEHSHECVTGFQCSGSEAHLGNCSSPQTLNCSSTQQLSITCLEFKEIRLTEGCGGNVEVFYNGSWGNVCWNQMNRDTMSLICQELNCGRSGDFSHSISRVKSATNWLDEVTCRPHDSNLWQCPSLPWGQNDCNGDEVARITCSEQESQESPRSYLSCLTSSHQKVCSGRSTSVTPPKTPLATSLSVPPSLVIVLGVLLLLLLVSLFILIQQNRVMRRALSTRHRMTTEAVYEEIRNRPTNRRNLFTQRGDLSESYDDVVFIRQLSNQEREGDLEDYDHVRNVSEDVRDLSARVESAPNCLDKVTCQPHDSNLCQCPFSPWGQNDCNENEVAKTTCLERVNEITPEYYEDVITDGLNPDHETDTPGSYDDVITSGHNSVDTAEEYDDVIIIGQDSQVVTGYTDLRLENGPDLCSGRVQLWLLNKWGTVCDACWDMRAASVLCRQLNCGIAVSVVGSDWFGEGSGEIWADVFDCDGNETKLSECSISSWSRAECSHRRDVGVICSGSSLALHDGLVRLSGERQCEGEVEVFIHQVWRRVLLDSWSLTESSVVCRQLGCGSVLNFYGSSSSSPEHSHECVTGFQCSGSEAHLGNCSSPQTLICSSTQQLSITCLEFKEIRLTEGCEGNVEVFYNGSWGNVCWNQMDRDTASLICQELNCGRSSSEPRYSLELKSLNWLDKLKCRRHDSTLWQCPSSPWAQNDCDNEVAKITCSDHVPLRLSGGEGRCSGRLEVYHNAVWGSVCDDQWDISDAQVVCRQLGCGAALRADGNSVFGAGEGVVWLNRVECRGNEIHLWDCPLSLKNHTDCSHKEHAGLTCADLSVSTTPATTTSVSLPVHSTSVTPPAVSLSVPPVLVIVLGVVLLLLLVPLLILIQQNRVIRRALSKRRHSTMAEAIYEEILHKQREQHSGYDNADELLSDDLPENYDDVVIVRQFCSDKTDWFGEGSGEIWADVFNCDGNETKLSECSISSWSRAERSHKRDVGVICSDSSLALHDGLVRLSGERQCEGEVEVFIRQVWRRVLLDSWSFTESSVVCRQLGCGSVLNFYGSSSSSPEHSHECVTGFQCSGSEAHLGNCSSPQTLNCSSTQQLSITCLEFKEIRLTEGCEGNVEVFYNGSWGNVCWNQIDRDTVSLICQELNCGRSGVFTNSIPRVETARNWLDKVKCRPHDSSLWQCPSLPWGQNDCSRDEVAIITCSDLADLSVFTTPATTTSASPPVYSTSVTPPAVSLPVPPELVIVMGIVLLLLLVPLLILIQQNRVMRRALSKRRHRTLTEAVYEEILHKQRGRVLSTEQHSGYEDADEHLSAHSPPGAVLDYYNDVTTTKGLTEVQEVVPENYDNVIPAGLRRYHDDLPDNYDDVIIVPQFCSDNADYDDVEQESRKHQETE
ncbi:hypothetical protein QQF64_035222 [Cirrhinus molitorella]|uniref:SRCR domain-containing protein n=1 Tax=Cirrhinus molitorella TaxID=172907 RepID=A0ABR3NF71_9TELE